jgi:hypothetical protein
MPKRLLPAVLLLLTAALGCNKEPAFTYDAAPGGLERMATFAVDPRQLIFRVDGKREVDPGYFRAAVLQELRAKGFTPGQAAAADLWVDVIVLAEAEREISAAKTQGEGDQPGAGRGRGKGAPPAVGRSVASGDLIVMVKLVSRTELKTLWYGKAYLPSEKSLPEESIRALLRPLAAR